jgi:hypothetical protein
LVGHSQDELSSCTGLTRVGSSLTWTLVGLGSGMEQGKALACWAGGLGLNCSPREIGGGGWPAGSNRLATGFRPMALGKIGKGISILQIL